YRIFERVLLKRSTSATLLWLYGPTTHIMTLCSCIRREVSPINSRPLSHCRSFGQVNGLFRSPYTFLNALATSELFLDVSETEALYREAQSIMLSSALYFLPL